MDRDQRLEATTGIGEFSIYDWDVETDEFIMDDFAGILGTAAADATPTRKSWDNLLHKSDRRKTKKMIRLHVDRKSPAFEAEYRVLTTSGQYRWFMERGIVIERNDGGETRKIRGVLVDICAKKNAEEMLKNRYRETQEALRRSEDEKEAILKGLQGLVKVRYLTPDFRIIWTNADAIESSCTGDGSTSPPHCYELLRGRTEPCDNCEAREALETGHICLNEESKPANDRYFIVRDIPLRDLSGVILGVVHIALNITEHRRAEEGLKTTSEFLHSLLGNAPTPICVSNRDGRIDTVNEAWEKTLGFTCEQVVGRLFRDIFPVAVATRINGINGEILASNTPIALEESINCPSGLRHFHTIRFPLQDGAGQTAAVGAISVDVTARKRAEQELSGREAELRSKSRQLGEMNTALRVLLDQREKDQRELEERFVFNVKELVLPYVHKLEKTHLSETQMSLLEIVETHLHDIVSPFLRQMVTHYPGMTAKELQVATFVREGKANKEIADLMNVSLNTIEIHRYNLRKKPGLQNKKVNLRSYLLSLNSLSAP